MCDCECMECRASPRWKKFELCASIACIASLNNDKYFLIRRIARITASDAVRCVLSLAILVHYIILLTSIHAAEPHAKLSIVSRIAKQTHANGFACYSWNNWVIFIFVIPAHGSSSNAMPKAEHLMLVLLREYHSQRHVDYFVWLRYRFAVWSLNKVKIKPPHELFYIIKCKEANNREKNRGKYFNSIHLVLRAAKTFSRTSAAAITLRLEWKASGRWGEREARAKKERNNVQFILVN